MITTLYAVEIMMKSYPHDTDTINKVIPGKDVPVPQVVAWTLDGPMTEAGAHRVFDACAKLLYAEAEAERASLQEVLR